MSPHTFWKLIHTQLFSCSQHSGLTMHMSEMPSESQTHQDQDKLRRSSSPSLQRLLSLFGMKMNMIVT